MKFKLFLFLIIFFNSDAFAQQTECYIAPEGSDTNPGTIAKPFSSLERARDAIRQSRANGPATVYLRQGTYYLPKTFVLTSEDSGTKDGPIIYQGYPGEKVTISGGSRLELKWESWQNGIMQAVVPKATATDQLFVNGERQHMARFPNFDPSQRIFNGYAADCFSPSRVERWTDPAGGFIHAMHKHMWGDFHYEITGKDQQGKLIYEGGWQNNRRLGMHDKYRFVENIFEELDAPGEWYLNEKQNTLFYYPPENVNLDTAKIEIVRLRHLIELQGTEDDPVKHIRFKNITFRHTARTFMDNKEPLLRSDWTTYRGGAIFFNGAQDCQILNCHLDQTGGNAVFVNKYNRRITVRGCHISRAGANGVAFVGDPAAVRNPLFEYSQRQDFKDIDKTAGPKGSNFPADCIVDDCLIYLCGRVEKQTSPIQISMSQSITVRHCSIYDVPRAGINISEGTWGGHVIEFCDIFDTVKETGDHGSFNSWGRDRYWGLKGIDLNKITLGVDHDLPLIDAVKPVTIRNNRWRCDHGWDIDLDDGSSNYHLYNNLCLNGGIKLREGFYRICENNIMVNNSFHPHVWYENSHDIFRNNIVCTPYKPIRVPTPWGKQCDYNLLHNPALPETAPAAELQQQSKLDQNSVTANALFIDPTNGDYRVADNSPAIKLGFKNFPMDNFGVQHPKLKAIARMPKLPGISVSSARVKQTRRSGQVHDWLGAKIKNIVGPGEISATGLHTETGVWIMKIPAGSIAEKVGLKENDVILQCGDKKIDVVEDLLAHFKALSSKKQVKFTVFRNQIRVTKTINMGDVTNN